MLKITFEYADETSGWQWREKSCVVSSVQECISFYGLGNSCEYRILRIEAV